MNYLDFEKLGYYDLKSQINNYILTRIKQIEETKDASEYDFCTTSGKLEELKGLFDFINSGKKTTDLKEIQDSNKSNT